MAIITITLIILELVFQASGTCNKQQEEFCLTPECVKTAAAVLGNLDKKVDPCHDFYRFACGNFINKTSVIMNENLIHIYSYITDNTWKQLYTILTMPIEEHEIKPVILAKKYFQACMNKDLIEKQGMQYFWDLYETLGGWPVLKQFSWNEEQFDWTNLTYGLRRLGLNTNNFLYLFVSQDTSNSSVSIVQLLPPQSEAFTTKVDTNIYFNMAVSIAVLFGINETRATDELWKSVEFEIELAKIAKPYHGRNITNSVSHMSISQLKVKYPKIPWLELINNILLFDIPLTDNDIIVVEQPLYFAAFEKLITETPKRVLANYAFRKITKEVAGFLPAVIAGFPTNRKTGVWKECTAASYRSFPLVLSSLYVRTYFEKDAKKDVLEMVSYIKNEFKEILKHIDWIDDTTRQAALRKLENMRHHIGYPDELLDDTVLEKYYDKLEISADQYFKSYLNIQSHRANYEYHRLRKPIDKDDWTKYGTIASGDPAYGILSNDIRFPAVILQSVFFNKHRPSYMNYGAIGTLIGHEISHGFSGLGIKVDENGNLFNWWNPKTEQKYLDKIQCLIYQYGNYTVPEINVNVGDYLSILGKHPFGVNGISTLNENLADNIGLKPAHFGYNSWLKQNKEESKLPGLEEFSPHQLFWISAAMQMCTSYKTDYLKRFINQDPHALEEFRVLGAFSNSVEFAKDFNCPSGSRMNPVQKCTIL